MRPFLLRAAGFAALQAAVAAVLFAFAARNPPPDLDRVVAAGASGEERLRAYLAAALRAEWDRSPGLFDDLERPAFRAAKLKDLMGHYFRRSDNWSAALLDKDERLREADGPRMIFVGGSGCAKGVDSVLVERRYGYAPVNTGLTINLRSRFVLRHAAAHVRPGDVVVVLFESAMLYSPPAPPESEGVRGYVAEVAPHLIDLFEPGPFGAGADPRRRIAAWKRYADRDALAGAAGVSRRGAVALTSLAVGSSSDEAFARRYAPSADRLFAEASAINRGMTARRLSTKGKIGRRSDFNAYGDCVRHRHEPFDGDRSDWPRRQPSDAGLIDGIWSRPIDDNVALLNGFARFCEGRGARAFFAFTPRIDYPGHEAFAKAFESRVRERIEMPVLCGLREQIFPEAYFDDSANHLNWRGTTERMRLLLSALDRHVPPVTPVALDEQIAARDREVTGRARMIAEGDGGRVLR